MVNRMVMLSMTSRGNVTLKGQGRDSCMFGDPQKRLEPGDT